MLKIKSNSKMTNLSTYTNLLGKRSQVFHIHFNQHANFNYHLTKSKNLLGNTLIICGM